MTAPRHLRRLSEVWDKQPVYFITTCVAARKPLLAAPAMHDILRDEWTGLKDRHHWSVGRYVVMPDHVHFFLTPLPHEVKPLSHAVGRWKEWTAKRIVAALGLNPPLWQPEFFDHVLRSTESRSAKWEYVRQNPVRAGLVGEADNWPYAGSIDFE
jgi:putative transposase